MKILLASPGPNIATLYRQFVVELACHHEVAVISRYAFELSEFAELKIQTYDPWTLEDLAQKTQKEIIISLKNTPFKDWALHGVNLWDASYLTRQKYAILKKGETPSQVLERAVANILSAQTILADFKPDTMVVWNGHNLESFLYSKLAIRAGAQTRYLERGLLPDALVLDPLGVNALSILCKESEQQKPHSTFNAEDQERIKQYLKNFRASKQSIVRQPKRTSSIQLRQSLHVPKDARLIVVPAQIEWDSNILLHSPDVKTNLDVLRAVEKELIRHHGYYLIFKTHPEDPDPNHIKHLSSDRIKVAASVNLPTLLDEAELIITRNSTVGLEAIAHEKPVLVLGKAIYSHRGFTYDVEASHPLATQLDQALTEGFTNAMHTAADQFFKILLKRYLYFKAKAEVFPGSNQTLLKTQFSSSKAPRPTFEQPGVLASEITKAKEQSLLEISRVTQDRHWISEPSRSPQKHALVVRFCSKNIFTTILEAISSSHLADRYTVLPRDPDLAKTARSIKGITHVIEWDTRAWLEGMRAQLGSYDLIIFIHDNAHQISKRIKWIRKSLAPIQVLGIDAGWAEYPLDPHRNAETST